MRRFLVLLAATSVLPLLSLASSAQDLPETELGPAAVENRYRVGIDCLPVTEPLQVHLKLDEGTGLIVNSVMDDSPASKAGLQRLDVIVEANERPVGAVMDLVRVVNEAGPSEMTLSIIRRGEEMQLKVTPEERDEEEIERIRRGFRNRLRNPGWGGFGQLPPEIQRQLERFGPLNEMIGPDNNWLGGPGWRRILPGIVMDSDDFPRRQLPDGFNLNIQVERSGDGPAKIKVQQGNKAWEVTEDNLDDLPEDVRGMVENMLNGSAGAWSGRMVPDQLVPRPLPRPDGQEEKQLRKRFDGLDLQLQELRDAIRSLQEDK